MNQNDRQVVDHIQRFWNDKIRQIEEPEGQDIWQLPSDTIRKNSGDCEDIAILKLATISMYELPEPFLLTFKHKTEGAHVVCLCGAFILDNLLHNIVPVEEYAKRYIDKLYYTSSLSEPKDPRFAAIVNKINATEYELIQKSIKF